jgi:two-component system response regulator RpfG
MTSIVIVDADAGGRAELEQLLIDSDPGMHVFGFAAAGAALEWITSVRSDLILVVSPDLDQAGIAFLRSIRGQSACTDVPLLIAARSQNAAACQVALELGGADFLNYPIDRHQCLVRCRTLLTLRRQQRSIEGRAYRLEREFRQAERKLAEREREILLRLARAGEFRDGDTGDHVLRIANYSRVIAETLDLPLEQCEIIEHSAPMHDIGKIGMPDHILLKPGRLSAAEWSVMRSHTGIGYEILKDSQSTYLQAGAEIAICHHERFDGGGYPFGLQGVDIPIAARIVAVADVFDALVSARPYKEAWSVQRALDYLVRERNRQFDPECVDAFLAQIDLVVDTHQEFRSKAV